MTSSTPPEEDHHHDGAEEEERTRALETIAALASILGQPTEWIPQKTQAEKAEPLPGTSTKNKNASTEVVVEAVLPATTEVEEVEAAPTTTTSPSSVVEADSVSAWAVGIKQRKKHRELSDDSMPGDCPVLLPPPPPPPHRRDPSSVQILDQDSLERTSTASQVPAPMFKDGRVIFREKVSMVEIPSYRDVDPEIAERVWTSPEEVYRNLERNAWEYNSVGRDWTKVLEEDQMIYDPKSGQYIHPATWELMEIERQEEERQQELMRLAQQEAERGQIVALEQQEAERRQRVALEQAAAQKKKKQHQQQKNKPRRRQTGRPATGQQQKKPSSPSSPNQQTSSQRRQQRRRKTSTNVSPTQQGAGAGAGQQQRQSSSPKGSPRATKSWGGGSSGRKFPPPVSSSGGSLTRFADT